MSTRNTNGISKISTRNSIGLTIFLFGEVEGARVGETEGRAPAGAGVGREGGAPVGAGVGYEGGAPVGAGVGYEGGAPVGAGVGYEEAAHCQVKHPSPVLPQLVSVIP